MGDKSKLVAVQVTFKNMEATDALKQYANEKLSACLKKYVHQNTDAHLVLKVEKKRQMAEISFHSDGADFKNSETSDDMYKSIDTLVDSLTTQLRRHKEKITSHH
jgi:putative sigma-54 modulation protein